MRRLPSVAVVGLGGVGGAVAASLATAGTCELTCIARGAGLDTLRRHGLRVTLHDKRVVSCGAVRAVEADVRATRAIGVQDTLILTTKAHQLDASLEAIAPLIGSSTSIVPLQNGLPHWFFAGFGGKALDGTDLRSIDPNGRWNVSNQTGGNVVDMKLGMVGCAESLHTNQHQILIGTAFN